MTRVLDIEATTRLLREAGHDPSSVFNPDPNTRRLLESLCIRHNIPAVYRQSEEISHD
jgi:hypothetical protein